MTINASSIFISKEYLTEETKKYLVSAVYTKAKAFDGRCKLLAQSREYHICDIRLGQDGATLGVGYGAEGDYRLTVKSEKAWAFPPSAKRVLAGGHLEALHIQLEDWMFTVVPESAIIAANRSVAGMGVTQDIDRRQNTD